MTAAEALSELVAIARALREIYERPACSVQLGEFGAIAARHDALEMRMAAAGLIQNRATRA